MNVFEIGGVEILPGERREINLDVAELYDYTEMKMPVEVIRGKKEGPILFICAAIHGDEINGVEIIRQILNKKALSKLRGTLIAVPIVNVFGFNDKSRYLPDRRDLNRCFPGMKGGSLASQMAHILMTEIISKSTHGIDLHTGAWHRKNLPQIRGNLNDPETAKLAQAFGTPVIINASTRDGSLRQAAADKKIPTLLYEGGETLRFEDDVIKIGVKGIMRVMRNIGMLPKLAVPKTHKAFVAQASYWVRAPRSGIHVRNKKLGSMVKAGEILGIISSPLGKHSIQVSADQAGIIIGKSIIPLVNKGDALFHIATFEDHRQTQEVFDNLEDVDPVNL
jgi:predicted deacylase